jgi:class 3 adenylate cyclase
MCYDVCDAAVASRLAEAAHRGGITLAEPARSRASRASRSGRV